MTGSLEMGDCLIDGNTTWDVNRSTVVGFALVGPHDGGKTCDAEVTMIAGAPKRHRGKANYYFASGRVATLGHLTAARGVLYPWLTP